MEQKYNRISPVNYWGLSSFGQSTESTTSFREQVRGSVKLRAFTPNQLKLCETSPIDRIEDTHWIWQRAGIPTGLNGETIPFLWFLFRFPSNASFFVGVCRSAIVCFKLLVHSPEWFVFQGGLMVMDSQFEIHMYIYIDALQMTVITDHNIHLQSSTNSHK